MTVPVLCVVGPSDSGKTQVMEALLRGLGARGHRVAAVKHCPEGYQLDRPGSDTDRLRTAGAARVAMAGPTEWAVVQSSREPASLERIAQHVGEGCDLVLAEGFRSSDAQKVLVLPGELDPGWEFPTGIIATVADRPVPGVEWRCGTGELQRLVELVAARFLEVDDSASAVSLVVDGEEIPLNTFARSVFARTLWGMVSSLSGIPAHARELRIRVWGRPQDLEPH